MDKQEETASLKTPNQKPKGKCTMKNWKLEQMKCSDNCPNHGKLQDEIIKRDAHEDSIVANAESESNKRPSKHHCRMNVELASNFRCKRWLARLPFRNSPH